MRKKFLLTLSVFFLLLFSITISIVVIAESNNVIWGSIKLENEYFLNEYITIPNEEVSINNDKYNANFILRTPDGNSFTDNDDNYLTPSKIKLTNTGIYTLEYYIVKNGKRHSKVYNFSVERKIYSATSDNTDFYYGIDNSDYNTELNGINLSLYKGDVFSYNKVVDLKNVTSADNLIKLAVLPQKNGECDLYSLDVILTDAYDSDNKVIITLKSLKDAIDQGSWDIAYASACAPKVGQITTGYAQEAGIKLQVNTIFGTYFDFSFYGDSFNKYHNIEGSKWGVADQYIAVSMDYSTKRIFVSSQYTKEKFVIDLDSSDNFNKLWGGFTTGEAFISLSGNNFYKDNANLIVTEMYGADLSESGVFQKESTPYITVDDSEISLENIIMPKGYSLKIPKATAVDTYNGILPVTTKIYLGYFSNQKHEVNIMDGVFIPQNIGVYTVEYSVTDFDGQKYYKTYDINVVESGDITLFLEEDYQKSGIIGEYIKIPKYSIKGGIGKINNCVSVKLNGVEQNVVDNSFLATKCGKYNVTITAFDYVNQTNEYSYDVDIGDNLNPSFIDEVIVPSFFIKGTTYNMPEYYAYDFHNNGNKIKADVFVNDIKVDKYCPLEVGDIIIKYVATSNTGSVEKFFNAKVIDVKNGNKLDITKYFDSENLVVSSNRIGTDFINQDTLQDAKTTFINYISANDFSLDFVVNQQTTNFNQMKIVLHDTVNPNNKIEIAFSMDTRRIFVCGKDTGFAFSESIFNTDGGDYANVSFDQRSGILFFGSNKYKIEDFSGFTGGLLRLEICLEEVCGPAGFSIRRISKQVMISIVTEDEIGPLLSYNGTYSVYSSLNSVCTVFSAVCSDLLSTVDLCYVSVKDTNNNIMTSTDGIYLEKVSCDREYKIKLTEYGKYSIEYYAIDSNGNTSNPTGQKINVIDDVPPVINISNLKTRLSVGSSIDLSLVSATDNLDMDVQVFAFISSTKNESKQAIDLKKYKFSKEGEYVFTFIAFDTVGNYSYIVHKVIVK